MMGPFEGSAGDRTREFTMSSVLATAAELSADTEAAEAVPEAMVPGRRT